MRTIGAIALGLAISVTAIAAPTAPGAAQARGAAEHGSWTARLSADRPDHLRFELRGDPHASDGFTVAIAALTGFDPRALRGSSGPVTFALRREAGIVTFRGRFTDGIGGGSFDFAADPAYVAALAKLGLATSRGEPSLLSLALVDVTTGYIRAMQTAAYRASLRDYLVLRAIDTTPDYAGAMTRAFGAVPVNQLVTLRATNADPDYVAALRRLFPGVEVHDVVTLRAMHVMPADVGALRSAGAPIRTPNEMIQFAALKVTPDMVRRAVREGQPISPSSLAQTRR